jgi:uncharacterized protein (DUF1778 family)
VAIGGKRKKQRLDPRTTFEKKAVVVPTNIVLSTADWKLFWHALNHPVASNAALKKLMNRKSNFRASS